MRPTITYENKVTTIWAPPTSKEVLAEMLEGGKQKHTITHQPIDRSTRVKLRDVIFEREKQYVYLPAPMGSCFKPALQTDEYYFRVTLLFSVGTDNDTAFSMHIDFFSEEHARDFKADAINILEQIEIVVYR